MKKIDLRDTESIIQFLEEDDYRHRTGYAKEHCWHYLKRLELTERQKQRLRAVALKYLHQRMRREFWYMCKFIHRIADGAFRAQVEQLIGSNQQEVSKRASFLSAYLESSEKGERTRKDFYSEYLHTKYGRPIV